MPSWQAAEYPFTLSFLERCRMLFPSFSNIPCAPIRNGLRSVLSVNFSVLMKETFPEPVYTAQAGSGWKLLFQHYLQISLHSLIHAFIKLFQCIPRTLAAIQFQNSSVKVMAAFIVQFLYQSGIRQGHVILYFLVFQNIVMHIGFPLRSRRRLRLQKRTHTAASAAFPHTVLKSLSAPSGTTHLLLSAVKNPVLQTLPVSGPDSHSDPPREERHTPAHPSRYF